MESRFGLITQCITTNVTFLDLLHGFRSKQSSGAAILEARLNMDLSNQHGQALHHVILDLSKAYDTLDQMSTLELL
jgi:hypothetical protein